MKSKKFLFRFLPAGVVFLFSLILLAYSIYFLHQFDTYGYVRSYFPWRWHDFYNDAHQVHDLFYLGCGLSIFFLLASLGAFYYFYRGLPAALIPRRAPVAKPAFQKAARSLEAPALQGLLEQAAPVKHEERSVAISILRKQKSRRSRIGAIVLLALSVALLLISYKFPNVVAEVDSLVAFAAAIVLIYKDTTHSVQLRVVDRIMYSSQEEISKLASLSGLTKDHYYFHVLKGERVSDVVLVPSGSEIELVPPGRALAQLFVRETGKERPALEDIAASMQNVFSDSLGLSVASALEIASDDTLRAKILEPVLKEQCNSQFECSVSSIQCSLLAVLVCFATGRSASIENCSHDDKENLTTIEFHLEPLVVEEKSKDG